MKLRAWMVAALAAVAGIPVVGAQTFFDWQALHFNEAELANPNISGPEADPSHGGIKNLLSYGLALNPSALDFSLLPLVGVDAGHLNLTFTVLKSSTDLIYTPEVSSDLVNWSSGVDATAVLGYVESENTMSVTVCDLANASVESKRFIRLRLALGESGSILPAWWQLRYFNSLAVDANSLAPRGDGLTNMEAFQQGLNPVDYYDGHIPSEDAPPAAPTNFRATKLPDGRVKYEWDDNSDNERGFHINRQDADGTWHIIATVGPNQTSVIVPAP